MTIEAIKAAIPHREPFLLLDEIIEQAEETITCRKRFTGKEFWYAGHYPGHPITPGVILCEAAMQAGAVLLSKIVGEDSEGKVPVATRANNVQFRDMVLPGDTVEIEVELTERLADAFFMKAKVRNLGQWKGGQTDDAKAKLACRFDFACTLAASS